ncbi:hypothetical protein A2U01_0096739, partial [Trifolium medium]|nr:hypothetical protein [Trifolium medium]
SCNETAFFLQVLAPALRAACVALRAVFVLCYWFCSVSCAARSSVAVVPVFFCQLRGAQGCPALRAELSS